MASGIADRAICETPIAILDFETTGLNAGTDRVIEVSVVRLEPGRPPTPVLDTLVNPRRRVAATEIHGITDADVADAPEFHEVTRDLVDAISGCVVAAYNVYFDVRFLEYELQRSGISGSAPHFCLMYMRPLLDLGKRCSLADACQAHGIAHDAQHVATEDALASARLMDLYLDVMRERCIRTFGELAGLRSYKFLQSFSRDPLSSAVASSFTNCHRLKPRFAHPTPPEVVSRIPHQPQRTDQSRAAMKSYWDALKAVIADLEITQEEIQYLRQKERQLELRPEQIRVLHARAFVSAIAQFVDDEWLDDRECRILRRLHRCLRQLGWAPGQ